MYKVVKYYPKTNKIFSFNRSPLDPSSIEYKINEWIYPKFGKIFVFKTVLRAIDYKREHDGSKDPDHHFRVYECEVLGEPELQLHIATDNYVGFWCGSNSCKQMAPYGTYVVDAVKLIKEIE